MIPDKISPPASTPDRRALIIEQMPTGGMRIFMRRIPIFRALRDISPENPGVRVNPPHTPGWMKS